MHNIFDLYFQKFKDLGKVHLKKTTSVDPDIVAATSLTGVVNEYFPTIRDWIQWFFSSESEVRGTINTGLAGLLEWTTVITFSIHLD